MREGAWTSSRDAGRLSAVYGDVAQSGERSVRNGKAAGPSPVISITACGMA